jgi:hypothetical protein
MSKITASDIEARTRKVHSFFENLFALKLSSASRKQNVDGIIAATAEIGKIFGTIGKLEYLEKWVEANQFRMFTPYWTAMEEQFSDLAVLWKSASVEKFEIQEGHEATQQHMVLVLLEALSTKGRRPDDYKLVIKLLAYLEVEPAAKVNVDAIISSTFRNLRHKLLSNKPFSFTPADLELLKAVSLTVRTDDLIKVVQKYQKCPAVPTLKNAYQTWLNTQDMLLTCLSASSSPQTADKELMSSLPPSTVTSLLKSAKDFKSSAAPDVASDAVPIATIVATPDVARSAAPMLNSVQKLKKIKLL